MTKNRKNGLTPTPEMPVSKKFSGKRDDTRDERREKEIRRSKGIQTDASLRKQPINLRRDEWKLQGNNLRLKPSTALKLCE